MSFTLTEAAQRFIRRVVRLSGGDGGEMEEMNGITLFLTADTAHEMGFKFYDPKATGICAPSAASVH